MNRVLICEGDPALSNDLAQSLQRAGWRARAARSPQAALQALDAAWPHAVLVDVARPEGLLLLERLVAGAAELPIVAMGAGTAREAARARELGARGFLRKPFALDALEAALVGALCLRPLVEARSPVSRSPEMRRLLDALRAAAATEATIQLVGELGTGKSDLAQWVHTWSANHTGPLVRIDCSTLEDLEVFQDYGGTLLLDDVDALPPRLQHALLETLQERSLGGTTGDRLLLTTRRSLRDEVLAGRFLDALCCRIDVITLCVPPLRERPEDLPLLAETLLERFARAQGVETPVLDERTLELLASHPFPGNLQELANLMRRAVVLFPGEIVDMERLWGRRPKRREVTPALQIDTLNLRDIERQVVVRSLAEHAGNRTRASEALGISVRTLRNKIREYGLA